MMKSRKLLGIMMLLATPHAAPAATITFVSVLRDQTDLHRLNIGKEGYWFPQFNAPGPVSNRPTSENEREALPPWAGPLNHFSIADPNPDFGLFATRTFSQDGPARSKGGQPTWNTLKLPNGEVGLSGAIVDPNTIGNSNNTLNRVQLGEGVPETFYLHIITDNTNHEHDPANRLRARGQSGGANIDPPFFPQTEDLHFNGVADVYTFRYDQFVPGDFIKLQLNGASDKLGASFGGLLFDTVFEPHLVPEPSGVAIALLGVALVAMASRICIARTRPGIKLLRRTTNRKKSPSLRRHDGLPQWRTRIS